MSRSLLLISLVARLAPLVVFALVSPAAEARRVWPLSEEGVSAGSPALAPAGRAHEAIAAWDEGQQGERVVARVVGVYGQPLSPRRELAAAVDGESVGGPAAAGRRAGYLVVWGRGLGPVEAVVLDRGGEPAGPVRTIAENARGYLRVVYQPWTREYLVLWLEIEGSGLDSTEAVFARRLDRRGEPLGPAVMVSPRYGNVRSYAVAARRDSTGYLVAWNRDGPDGVGIEARALSSAAEPAGPVRAIGPGYASASGASVALAWNGRERTFVLATHDYRVRLYRVEPDGTRRGRAHTIRPGPTIEQEPKVVVLAYERRSDTLLVVWVEGDEYGRPPFHTKDLQARRLDAARLKTLDSYGVPRRAETFNDVCCPAVAAFRGSGYLVGWAGERGDGYGIFAQSF